MTDRELVTLNSSAELPLDPDLERMGLYQLMELAQRYGEMVLYEGGRTAGREGFMCTIQQYLSPNTYLQTTSEVHPDAENALRETIQGLRIARAVLGAVEDSSVDAEAAS